MCGCIRCNGDYRCLRACCSCRSRRYKDCRGRHTRGSILSNGDAGTPLLECGFEDDAFPPQGWSAKVTNSYDYLCSWFHYPSDQFKQTNNWEDYIHTGEKSAMSYIDIYAMKGDHDPAQDEWLMTPAIDGASYLELYYFIDPTVLEYGADEFSPTIITLR